MKFSSAYIQAIGIIIMLGELPKGKSLKSLELSKRMDVSHSYLQKISTKLTKKELITSVKSKAGGYQLKKSLSDMTFLDVFEAMEDDKNFLDGVETSPIYNMFINQEIVEDKVKIVTEIHNEAEKRFKMELKKHKLIELLPKDEDNQYLEIDWSSVVNERRNWNEFWGWNQKFKRNI